MIRENLTEVEPRSLLLILILISLLVATSISLYIIKPQYLSFNANSTSYEQLQNQIDDQAQLQRVIDEQREKIEALQLQLHGEAGEIAVNEMEAYLLGRLQGLAWQAGIELAGVRPGLAKRILDYEEISFNVEVTGTYRNLYEWLGSIGDTLGFMLVSKYEISSTGRKNDQADLKMQLTMVFYRAVDK